MAFMFVRVELHENSPTDKPSGADYDKLHVNMLSAGFPRTITVNPALPGGLAAGDYELPHATYASNKFETTTKALVAAWEAATGLGYKYSVSVAGPNFDAFGLKPVKLAKSKDVNDVSLGMGRCSSKPCAGRWTL